MGALVAATVGVIMQQLFLRWNQGQDLRQAIITIAVTVILADQLLYQYGGLAKKMVWPGDVVHFFEIFGQALRIESPVHAGDLARRRHRSCGSGSTGHEWGW